MNIQLSDHFTYRRLLRFALPSILMMVFTSIYSVVDGYFISNFAGDSSSTGFAAVNFIMPFVMILGGMGMMFGTGGCALIGRYLGEGRKDKANEVFSLIIYFSIAVGFFLMGLGDLILEPVTVLLGAEEGSELQRISIQYARIVLIGTPAYVLQYEFQSFCAVAEKPKLGLYMTIASGVMNMALDALLVGVFHLGVPGAAIATVASQFVGGLVPFFYFLRRNSSLLRIGKPKWDSDALFKTCTNGSSEFVSNISMSVVGMLYNAQLLKYFDGSDGVSAYGVLMYVNFVFISMFIGYSVGTAPIVSFHYGAGNTDELKSVLRKSLVILGITAACMLAAGELLARPIASLFVSYDEELMNLTHHAFVICSISFPFSAVPIYGSSFFTALNDGLTSALISFLRTVVFQVAAVLLMPVIFGQDGIWWSIVAAEVVATSVTVFFWLVKQKKYQY